ncbi:MAG: aa3-type cytochrome c oxidase subunit IV [Terricaulis sp.]
MVEASHNAHGEMEISDQRETFHGFLNASLWGSTHIAQAVALLTLAFAIGAGWWAGVAAVVAIGVVVGLLFKSSGAWWAVQIAQAGVLILGGLIVPALVGLMN